MYLERGMRSGPLYVTTRIMRSIFERGEVRTPLHLLLGPVCLFVTATLVRAATFNVTSTMDAVDASPGDGICASAGSQCTLRAAVQEANALPGADTIMLPAGTYVLTVGGASARCEDAAAKGDLDITDDVTIIGAGAPITIIDGNGIDRVFDVAAKADIRGVTIRNGNAGTTTCPSGIGPVGGAIYSAPGTVAAGVTLTEVAIMQNTATHGAGIENDLGSSLDLNGVTVSANTASIAGGGIENLAGAPGTTLANVTVSGNSAGSGGGIRNEGDLTLESVTMSGNTLDDVGERTIKDTIVAGSPFNCTGGGSIIAEDHNLDSGNSCGLADSTDLRNTNPNLGPLQDNGGPTLTLALLAGSPAIDAGSGDCPPPATDQRGTVRPVDGNGDGVAVCDIGAYEFLPGTTATTTTSTTTTLPACTSAPTLESIMCRLQALVLMVQGEVSDRSLRDGLGSALAKSQSATRGAQAALAQGSSRRARAEIVKAIRSLKKFTARLRSRRAKRLIPDDVRSDLRAKSGEVRQEMVALKGQI